MVNQTSNLKNIVFDLGGVLIDWNPRYLYRNFFVNKEVEMEDFLQKMFTEEWTKREDTGRPLLETIEIFCQQYPEKTDLVKAYHERWYDTLGGEIVGTVAILKQLKQKDLGLYALTNWSNETFPYAKKRFAFLNDFADIVVSGEEKVIKPDPKIYEILLQRNKLQAHESVFIDDRLVNVKAAEALGMIGLHFTSSENLQEALLELGVL